MHLYARRIVLAVSAAGLATVAVSWQPSQAVRAQSNSGPASNSPEFYTQRVQPIFANNCYRCHGGMNHRGGLNIDTRESLLKGGHTGPAIVPGDPSKSLLVTLIRHEGPASDPMPMPPKGDKLSDADIATVTAWIKAGAVMPAAPAQ